MPRHRNFLMLIVAVVAGLAAFFLTLRALTPAKEAVKERFLVVSTGRDIAKGNVINKEDCDLIPAPDDINPALMYTDINTVIGKIANRDIPKGSVVRSIDILAEGDNAAILIPEGYQAVTIPVSLPSNLANLIRIGNRVDILLTYQRDGREFKSLTLMKNVLVISLSRIDGGGASHITIAVTSEGAKTIAYAMQKGVLNVAIRSLAEQDQTEPETFYTLDQLFKDQEMDSYKAAMTKIPLTEEIEIIRGLNRETYRFVEGKMKSNSSGQNQ